MLSFLSRAIAFAALWLILSGADPGGFAAGAFAVTAATWTSLTLSPANGMRASPAAIGRIVFRLVWQSALAGADVAWRALAPRLRLRPGLVRYPVRLATGAPTSTFCMLSSLVPGTLPSGFDATGALLVHCLDLDQPVTEHLSGEEALLRRALGGEPG
ncbi:MAG TPA: Na+/H+ antiporter subunit E [Xanthobacteraceae bacterium]|jgi:multicomponent Na+:H+ antiporter subunit E